jgi:hypothetical protein
MIGFRFVPFMPHISAQSEGGHILNNRVHRRRRVAGAIINNRFDCPYGTRRSGTAGGTCLRIRRG